MELGTKTKMKQLITIFIFSIASTVLFGQYDGKGDQEISRFRPGFMWYAHGWRKGDIEKMRKYDRLIFDVTYNDWVGDEGPFENHWASIGLNTNFMFDIPLTKGNTVALGVGLSHQLVFIRHNGNLVIDDSAGTTVWQPMLTNQFFKKSSFGANSFSIPLEIRFRKESWKHAKLHVGGKVGYQVNAFSKTVSEVSGNRTVVKQFGFPDEGKLLYSAHVRFGIRNWALFGSYNFNPMFENVNSTKLNHLQLGLSVSLF